MSPQERIINMEENSKKDMRDCPAKIEQTNTKQITEDYVWDRLLQ